MDSPRGKHSLSCSTSKLLRNLPHRSNRAELAFFSPFALFNLAILSSLA